VKKSKLVMVGNGMAGVRTLEELLKVAPDLYDITVFGAEPHPNYNRILLSPVLAGEQTHGRDRAQLVGLVHREPHHPARGWKSGVGGPRASRIVPRRFRRLRVKNSSAEYDRLLAVHRLQALSCCPCPAKTWKG
jgi:nitrite reductase (NADH) large subunit